MDVETIIQDAGLVANSGWITQVFIVVVIALLLDLAQKIIFRRLLRQFEKTKNLWDDAAIDALRKPLSALIWVVGIAFAASIVAQETDAAIFSAVTPIRDVGVIASIAWFLIRLIKRSEENIIKRPNKAERGIDNDTVHALAKLLRLSVIITAALVVLQTLGFSISGVLAFGGIGGIAVGFAAKDMLANVFGGLMLYLDRPFSVGDWIRSPDREIEGTVESIGWRLTLIRTFDKRPLYIPNSIFSTITVENPSRMTNRRIYETIGIRYDDDKKLAAIIADVKAMLKAHPEIDQTKTLMVNFNSFGSSSLDFFIYTFTKTTVWTDFHDIKQEILLLINDIIVQHDAEFAFPTSTVHLPDVIQLEQQSAVRETS